MKQFFALPALLRSALLLASASQSSFSVNDDLLAFPQFEIRFTEDVLTQEDADLLMVKNEQQSSHTHSLNDETQLNTRESDTTTPSSTPLKPKHPIKYERLVLDSYPFICSIPQVPTPNTTLQNDESAKNDTLTQAEQAKELARATDRGWELLSGMEGNCVYYISGWWSYRFCYGQGIKQFHQLPPSRGVPNHPPMEDPNVGGYELGVYQKPTADEEEEMEQEKGVQVSKRKASWNGELVTRGETRYLVQRLGGGTTCDLTGKQRTIEVQFHCNPQFADRISLIKETATCAYLMVIQTPRLCNDVAFLPPRKDHPNEISCSPILPEDEIEQYKRDMQDLKNAERNAKIWEENADAAAIFGIDMPHEKSHHVVGDITVGGHDLVPPGSKIERGTIVGGGKERFLETLASSDGKTITDADLARFELGDGKAVKKLRDELEKYAGDQEWRLDVVETPRGREYRGIIGSEEEEGEKEAKKKGEGKAKKKASSGEEEVGKKQKGENKEAEPAPRKKKAKPVKVKEEEQEENPSEDGSQEEYFYRDEL